MTLTELLEQLQAFADQYDPDIVEVRLAHQPGWPFELSIGGLALRDPQAELLDEMQEAGLDDSQQKEELARIESEPVVLYIGEGRQIGYLPGEVARELGWR